MGKAKTLSKKLNNKKRKLSTTESDAEHNLDSEISNTKEIEVVPVRNSDDPVPKKVKWINKQRVLTFASRGISYRDRHLLEDIRTLLPHSKPDNKKDDKDDVSVINEIAEMKNCNKCIYFEAKKHKDLYMWISNILKGPSIKFLVENIHTMKELKLTGNSLKGSRPLVCFDRNFEEPHWKLMKELLLQIFSVPKGHPKSQPFFDHVFIFSVLDSKIWFRNYQIVEEDGQLTEIGPRFVLNPIKIFEGSFSGTTLWSNPSYKTPAQFRRDKRKEQAPKYINKVSQKKLKAQLDPKEAFGGDPTLDYFELGSDHGHQEWPQQNRTSISNKKKRKRN